MIITIKSRDEAIVEPEEVAAESEEASEEDVNS